MWYEIIKNFLKSLNFKFINSDNNVFVNKNKKIYIVVYVNDLLIVNKNINYINEIKSKLSDRFKMHDLKSTQHYLSIKIVRDDDNILFRQINYLKKMLKRFEMKNCKFVDLLMKFDLTTIMISFNNEHQIHANIIYWYELIVGSLIYAMTMTRFDLINALSIINRYLINSDSTHVAAFQRIFRYIQKTFNYELKYESLNEEFNYFNMLEFHDYFDADWIDTKNDRFSINDHIFFVVEKSILWNFKRQDHIIMFNCEFEYYVLAEVEKKVVWLRELLLKLNQIDDASAFIWMNNLSVKAFSKNFEFHRRIKHIDVRYHWMREEMANELLQLKYISTAQMTADGLTKPLEPLQFSAFLIMIRMAYWPIKSPKTAYIS